MSKINILDDHLMNMIAAGEVVERPAGIVKELIDNSIDAKAKYITIKVEQGGISKIVVIDDGEGMDSTDAMLAFQRHATSKLKVDTDLWNIKTLGFRGEALPSIASVSKVSLISNNGVETTNVIYEYSKLIKNEPIASNKGTMISVEGLFLRTPARFKHLSSCNYELTLISDIVSKFALAYPSISFNLYSDNKLIFNTNGNDKLLEVIMKLYSRDIVKTMIAIDNKDIDYEIKGYLAQPQYARSNKNHIYIYINDRMIRNYRLSKEIIDAYSSYVPNARYPIAILKIYMDPKLVDVNVHPSKWEIRLSKAKQLEELIYSSIKQALDNEFKVSKVVIESKVKYENLDLNEQLTSSLIEEATTIYNRKEVSPTPITDQEEVIINDSNDKDILEKFEENVQVESQHKALPVMNVIGQLSGKYILAQGDEGLYLIDQHAAQERVHYEEIKDKITNNEVEIQELLVPLNIELHPSIIIEIDSINELIKPLGLNLEQFGTSNAIIRDIPIWLANNNYDVKSLIIDLMDMYIKDNKINVEKLREKSIATLACHSSIRFNRVLTIEEMNKVILDLRKCKQPFHCPHGRPTFILLTHNQLEKEFYRCG